MLYWSPLLISYAAVKGLRLTRIDTIVRLAVNVLVPNEGLAAAQAAKQQRRSQRSVGAVDDRKQ
jgi:hypothetical protein